MKVVRISMILVITAMLMTALACHKGPAKPTDLKVFSCDTLENVTNPNLVTLDQSVFKEGKGSIKISTDVPMTVPLFNVPYPDAQGAKLIFRAQMKAERFGGDAYLQMKLFFPGGGSTTYQDYKHAIHGATDWVTKETIAEVRVGQKVESAQLNLVVSGQGTLWVDDVHLIKAPQIEEK